MQLGFSFRQTLSGVYWRLDAPTQEQALVIAITATTDNLRAFARDRTWKVSGTLHAERLATRSPIEGTLAVKPLDGRRLAHHLWFSGDDGARYELVGQGEWSRVSPIESLTLVRASLYDQGGLEIARCTLRFDLRSDWAKWLKSFRPNWAY